MEPPGRWEEIDALLAGALELPAEHRPGYVRARTSGNPDLARAVIELLRAGEEASSFLERPILSRLHPSDVDDPPAVL